MANCTNCGHSLRSYDRRCGQCGTEVPKPSCKSCGAELTSAYAFSCTACGTRVERDTPNYQSKIGRGTRIEPGTKLNSKISGHSHEDLASLRAELTSQPTERRVDSRTDNYPFVNPSTLYKVLYVAPESAKNELQSIFYRVHRANRGDVIWVSADSALEKVQAELQKKAKRISAVCLIGTDACIPHIRWENPVDPDIYGMAAFEKVETDNPYGMLSNPSAEERMTGHVINDIPVTRIPSLNPELIRRLLGLHKDLASSWDNGLVVSAAVWEGPSRYTVQQYSEFTDVPVLLSPPDENATVSENLQSRNPSRLMFNVHGSDMASDWYGHGNNGMPVALTPTGVEVAENAVVLAEACYGAMVGPNSPSIALEFLEHGAGCFVGSTIIAWGAVGEHVHKGSSADAIAEYFYHFLDQGIPSGEALRTAKLRILHEEQDENGVIDAMTHNTLASFIVYGAPFAQVSQTTREFGEEYSNLIKSYRELPDARSSYGSASKSGSVLARYRQRLKDRLPADVWEQLDVSSIALQTVLDEQTIQDLGLKDSGMLSKYRTGLQVRSLVVAVDANNKPKMALILDEQNQILQKQVVR